MALNEQSKRSLALCGLAGGIDYLITGSNLHALSVSVAAYSAAQLGAPYLDRLLASYREARVVPREKQ